MVELLNRKLREGDTDSFSDLFKQTHPRLMGYCSLFIKDKKEAEDLVQECFYHLWENRQKIDLMKSVESLLFVSLRNRCLNYLKEHSRYSFNSLNEGVVPNELQYLYQLDFMEQRELSLEEQLVSALNNAINRLPERQKEILVKCKIEGRKQKEVASELGITIKAVEKSLVKSKTHLKNDLMHQFPELVLIISFLLH
ncbi:RNA polymerase sigma-70 factor [Sunxiuqinia sp. A32]|uniref:RNA polymerase sigma-70 factor n=1 Tax=Sunxiuqinia sp. A32 TaxID=3461496 RepID=UPI004045C84B